MQEKIIQKETGEFTPKDRFIEFVSAKGNVHFISDTAYVESKHLTGSFPWDVKFLLTIYPDGTVDFEEVETQHTTKSDRERLLELISDKTVSPSSIKEHMVINEVPFISKFQAGDKEKDIRMYLAVEVEKPIERLASLLDDTEIDVSEDQLSKLNDLFGDDDDTTEEEIDIEYVRSKIEEGEKSGMSEITSSDLLKESFAKMKEEKIKELESRIEIKKKDLRKFEGELAFAQSNRDKIKEELNILQSRIESTKPRQESNGYVFFVSEMMEPETELSEDIENLIREKVSKIKSINVDMFMKLFENGKYQIYIGKRNDDGILEEVVDYMTLSDEISSQLSFLDVVDDGGKYKLLYKGEMTWHDLVNKMNWLGFDQDPEFDKMCGSNSYEKEHESHCRCGNECDCDDCDEKDSSIESSKEFIDKPLMTFSEPTDLIVIGRCYDEGSWKRDVELTDDETNFDIYVGGKERKKKWGYTSDGFISILTLKEYAKYKDELINEDGAPGDSVFLSSFVGEIGITARLSDGSFSTDFDPTDYIQNHFSGMYEDECEWPLVIISLPEGTEVIDMPGNKLPQSVIRDKKIEKVVK